jgi:putative alpha-1,2-mannosidase
VAGTPLVPRASIRVGDGRTLLIERAAVGSASMNGQPVSRTDMPHALLAAGGTLRLGPR